MGEKVHWNLWGRIACGRRAPKTKSFPFGKRLKSSMYLSQVTCKSCRRVWRGHGKIKGRQRKRSGRRRRR